MVLMLVFYLKTLIIMNIIKIKVNKNYDIKIMSYNNLPILK